MKSQDQQTRADHTRGHDAHDSKSDDKLNRSAAAQSDSKTVAAANVSSTAVPTETSGKTKSGPLAKSKTSSPTKQHTPDVSLSQPDTSRALLRTADDQPRASLRSSAADDGDAPARSSSPLLTSQQPTAPHSLRVDGDQLSTTQQELSTSQQELSTSRQEQSFQESSHEPDDVRMRSLLNR